MNRSDSAVSRRHDNVRNHSIERQFQNKGVLTELVRLFQIQKYRSCDLVFKFSVEEVAALITSISTFILSIQLGTVYSTCGGYGH